jgi:hypothetical protein
VHRQALCVGGCRIAPQEGERDRAVEPAEQPRGRRVVGLQDGPQLMLEALVLDHEALTVADERLELRMHHA